MSSKTLHAQRGQTFPVWLFGTLTTLLMMVLGINYGYYLTWQIRAQNAADAAAQGALSIQATQWNQTSVALHAAAIEEYRIRRLMDGLLLTIHKSGGCTDQYDPMRSNPQSCTSMYVSLRAQYYKAVARYTNDILILQRVATPGMTDAVAEMQKVVTAYAANCGTPKGGDCAFNYSMVNAQLRTDHLENAEMDAKWLVVGAGTTGSPKPDLTPLEIQVVTCKLVQPLIPDFFRLHVPAFKAIGRAAATEAMVTQEWLDPGAITNPLTGKLFQPTEYPETPSNQAMFNNYDWYGVEFGGNAETAFPDPNGNGGGYQGQITNDEFSEWVGWWSSIPIRPYPVGGTRVIQPSQFTCS